ncbi:hypothetical protein [Subtercola endophyticus]|uniref:hypothetical protein n=1 Tax=Subtercola endophyticus TaxID=2895559 RepID=UPI001E39FCFB|nr:hypothetical protein [Subtercola endophyticus]UFS58008.1 hypothetical protein LQ955_13385 [Subtercola endophyticus]
MFGLMWILLASALVWVLASVVTSLVVGRVVAVADDRDHHDHHGFEGQASHLVHR